MNNIIYGLEISVTGFTVTMVTLLILAGILLVFTKVFSGEKKEKTKGEKLFYRKLSHKKNQPQKPGWRQASPARF